MLNHVVVADNPAFKKALEDFINEMTSKQKKLLIESTNSSLADWSKVVRDLDKIHKTQSRSRRVIEQITPVLEAPKPYLRFIRDAVQADQTGTASVLVGGFALLIEVYITPEVI